MKNKINKNVQKYIKEIVNKEKKSGGFWSVGY